jgi:hypothetical protein
MEQINALREACENFNRLVRDFKAAGHEVFVNLNHNSLRGTTERVPEVTFVLQLSEQMEVVQGTKAG